MKKLILTAMAVAGMSLGAYAQGTVSFNNFSGAAGLVYTNATANVGTNGGGLAVGSTHLELFYGPAGDTLAQLLALNTGTVFTYTFASGATAGKFFDGTTVVTSGPLGAGSGDSTINIELAVAGWLGTAANYTAATLDTQNNVYQGITLVAFGNPTGGAGATPALPANLVGWLAGNPLIITPVPEPTTMVLSGLGAAALLLFRRRRGENDT